MNCHDFEMIILALARNQLLDAAAREQSLIHTEACVRCAGRLTAERALIAGVRAVAAEIANEEAPARVEATLLTAFRNHIETASSPVVIPMPITTRRLPRWKIAAVAAGILILISAMAIFWQGSGSVNEKHEAEIVTPAPVAPPAEPQAPQPEPDDPAINRDNEMAEQTERPRQRRQGRHRAPEQNLIEVELVTRFFPLVDEAQLASLDSFQVMRVELPGSALMAVGLPVGMETVNEPIKADVVLGHDGLARAIRFVR